MSTFRKINNWLHLWLGLISGIIVFIVCITGCLWVFNDEIIYLLEPEARIEKQEKAVIMPSQLMKIASEKHPGLPVSYATYQQGRAIYLGLGERRGPNVSMRVDPYTGKVISEKVHKEGETDFFRWALNGHRFLWLPFEIGRPIVNYGTLVFVILLITGLVWWYPKKWTQSTRDKSFKIKWNGTWKRINLDLHNVLGFYSLLFLLAIALTGMVYGIEWYSDGLYWVTSGGDKLEERSRVKSDSINANKFFTPEQAIDKAWLTVINRYPKSKGFYYSFPNPKRASAAIFVTVYPSSGQFYNSLSHTFDQHTVKELPGNKIYGRPFEEAGFGGKLRRMNYDIHVGSILGFPGKVLAFLCTLIGASLPVTGFIVWWNRKGFGGKKKGKKVKSPGLQREMETVAAADTTVKKAFKPKAQKPADRFS